MGKYEYDLAVVGGVCTLDRAATHSLEGHGDSDRVDHGCAFYDNVEVSENGQDNDDEGNIQGSQQLGLDDQFLSCRTIGRPHSAIQRPWT